MLAPALFSRTEVKRIARMALEPYVDAADYYRTRILQAHEGDDSDGLALLRSTGTSVGTLNELENQVGPLWSSLNKGVQQGIPLGTSWLNFTGCANMLHLAAGDSVCNIGRDEAETTCDSSADGAACDTGWCDAMSYTKVVTDGTADPSVCSNSASFSFPSFALVLFANAAPYLAVASATVAITPDYSAAEDGVEQTYDVRPSSATAITDALSGSKWAGKRDDFELTALEDGTMTCFAGSSVSRASLRPYVYGPGPVPAGTDTGVTGTPLSISPGTALAGTVARALRSSDTVSFEMCRLHQQLMKCHSGGNVCNGTTCCNIGTSTRDACHNFTPGVVVNGFCSRYASLSDHSPTFKPWPQYFNVVRGGGAAADVACAGTDDGKSCVLVNGVTDLSSTGAFQYEPNSHRDPRNLASGGPVLGIPVKYSLLYSADGTDPATGSYLTQFASGASSVDSTAAAPTYASAAGFLALGDFGVRLTTALTGSAEYSTFAAVYFAYALVQRVLLQFYGLAALAHLDGTTLAPYALFEDDERWAGAVCDVWTTCAPASVAAGKAVNLIAAQVCSGTFLRGARPLVSSTGILGQVRVTLTVPSLLLSWSPAALLMAMFPFTSANFVLPVSEGADAFSGTFESVQNPPSPPSLFSVVPGSTATEYFAVVSGSPVPVSTGTAPPPSPSTTKCLVGARVTFTVDAAEAQSVTLLFYLYCVAAGLATLEAECVADLPVALPPALVDGSNVCGLTGGCLQTGFSGPGSSALNVLFVTANSTICKCLWPANAVADANTALSGGVSTGGAFMDTAAMCFNKFCHADGIDLASIVATARCAGTSTTTTTGSEPVLKCADMCDAYVNLLNASSDYDASAVDFTALRDTCDVNLTAPPNPLPRYPLFLATLVLVVLCVPVFVAIYAACATDPRAALTRPSFLAPAIVLFLLCCAAAAYAFVDLRGMPWCSGVDYRAGVHWPASTCKSAGFFGLLPTYTLPASFCSASSYCMCRGTTTVTGTTGACSGTCRICTDTGACTSGDGDPSLAIEHKDVKFDPMVAAFSGAVAACVVPAAVLAFWQRTPAFAGKAFVAVLLCLVLLFAAAVPLALQALSRSFYRVTSVGVVDSAACA
jgi:hypothetical protein